MNNKKAASFYIPYMIKIISSNSEALKLGGF